MKTKSEVYVAVNSPKVAKKLEKALDKNITDKIGRGIVAERKWVSGNIKDDYLISVLRSKVTDTYKDWGFIVEIEERLREVKKKSQLTKVKYRR